MSRPNSSIPSNDPTPQREPHFGRDFLFLDEIDGDRPNYGVHFKSQSECAGFAVSAISEVSKEVRKGNLRFNGDPVRAARLVYDLSIARKALEERFPNLAWEAVEERNVTVVNTALARALCDAETFVRKAVELLDELDIKACNSVPNGYARRGRLLNRARHLLPEFETTHALALQQARIDAGVTS
ncbi:hypothetical protein ABU614_21970 [Lysobacter firmicutimachus]|uniref:Uncharacterized protein n=1 Tax=Lysobacter firmicutimachus TaxID=1792846 RepID=A0AAU8MTG3_9GAMM